MVVNRHILKQSKRANNRLKLTAGALALIGRPVRSRDMSGT